MRIVGPATAIESQCERVLRSLPQWFGIESSLLEYVEATKRLPTFIAAEGSEVVAFVSLERHFAQAWEIHCIAVHASARGNGIGRSLLVHAEAWIREQGAKVLQVKTLAATHPSESYAQTRRFYEAMGFVPIEVFPDLWAPHLPVLQMAKVLQNAG